ncbi:MATE family efflux transporter [Pseudomonas sp. F1_0610]
MTAAVATSFYARVRQEFSTLMGLAIPIFIAQLANTGMGVADTIMAGRVSSEDLAGVSSGSSVWIPIFLFMTGVAMATTSKVARLFGSGDERNIGVLVRQSLWLNLLIGCVLGVVLWNARPLLELMHVENKLMDVAIGYLQAIAIGFPFLALSLVLRSYSEGIGRTRPGTVINFLGLLLNIPLNYILINGKFGFPELGGVGCGWATAAVCVFNVICFVIWIKWAPYYRKSMPFKRFDFPKKQPQQELIKLGFPIGIAIFVEASIFSVITLLLLYGGLNADTVSGHQVALSISSVTFMVPYAITMSVTVRVGQNLGAGNGLAALFSAKVAMACAILFSLILMVLMLCFTTQLASIYSREAEVIAIASTLIVFAAFYQLPDAIQLISAGALRGYQDTNVVMLITLIAYWGIGLPLGYSLGLTQVFGIAEGPAGFWKGLIAALTCAAIFLSWRLYYTARKNLTLFR